MKKLFSMREALSDDKLLARALPGPSWAAWRVLLIACMGERLTASERKVFKRLTGRNREPGAIVETLLVVAGRRSGKSRAASVLTTYLACLCDWREHLAIGEKALALYLAPSARQAEIVHDYSATLIDDVPLLAELVTGRTNDVLRLQRSIDLETQAASPRYSRGMTCISVTLDECAYFRSADDVAVSDTELMVALRPSLATTSGMMVLTSSPAQMEGVVFNLHKRHFGPQGDPLTLVVHSDSVGLNPSLKKSVIDRAFENDPVGAASEYGAEFRQPVANYLERSIIEKCIEPGMTQRTRVPVVPHRAFIDVAGGAGTDSFTACIGHTHRDNGREVCVIDCLFEARPPFNPETVAKQVADLCAAYGVTFATGDAYGGSWPMTAFARHGISYAISPLAKSEIYLHTLPLWVSGRVAMLDNQRAVDQLASLKRKLMQGGREVIDHAKGGHDDLANVVSGLCWLLTPPKQKVFMGAPPFLGRSGVNPAAPSAVGQRHWAGAI